MGLRDNEPTVDLQPSREQVLKSAGFVKVATIRVLPKLRNNLESVPVYLFLYWAPNEKKWLPERLALMSSRGKSGPVPIF